MSFLRLIKDIWKVIKLIPANWSQVRYFSKIEHDLKKLEKKHGIVGTFIHLLERSIVEEPDEFVHLMIQNFVDFYNTADWPNKAEENTEALEAYCNQYRIVFEGGKEE